VGLTPEQVRATVDGDGSEAFWSESDRSLLRLADALHTTAHVDDALWAAVSKHFDEAQRVELVVLAGFYHTISFVVNALRIDGEPGAPRFPG
jgi:alkylhydroperoxidase family enzyme